MVEVMEDGKSVGYYVDRYIADSLNNVSPERVEGLTRWAQTFQHKYFWKVTILYNLGFGGWGNPIRDILTNFRKLPLKGLIVGDVYQLASRYAKAAPHAWRWIQNKESAKGWKWLKKFAPFRGSEDQVIDEMIDSYGYAMPLSDLALDEADTWAYQLKRAGIYDAVGQIKKGVGMRTLYNATRFLGAPLRFLQQFTEMVSKAAGRQVRIEAGEGGKQLAYNVRNFTGTPNYDVKGKNTSTSNSWLPFSNIIKEGWKSEYYCATDPKMRSGYWLRTSKLLFLKMLTILAELGALGAIFGEDLEKNYRSISRYYKNHYLVIPISEPDKNGKVAFIPLPQDEMTRVLGAVMRNSLIIAQHRDPQGWAHFMQYLQADLLPSVTPMASVPATWMDFMAGGIVIDRFRQTPIMSDSVRKANDYRAKMKMVYWSINELGLGQFATYDDSTQTWYEAWTQEDPIVGRLAGRMVKVSNYGTVEAEKGSVYEEEMMRERNNLDRKESTPTVEKFYSERYAINRHHTLVTRYTAEGRDPEELLKEYPEAVWFKLYNKTSDALIKLQGQLALIDKDSKLTEKDKNLQKILVLKDMDDLARNALIDSGKIKTELPKDFGAAPEIK